MQPTCTNECTGHRLECGRSEYANVSRRPQPRDTVADYVTLRRFVLHKAYHRTLPVISLEDAWVSSLEEFLGWINGSHCENEGDPRCLPFHVFDTGFDLRCLDSQDGRRHFAGLHGAQSSRLDGKGLGWTRGVPHGYETLQVAGHELRTGFHWDVAGKLKQHITTTSEVWKLKPNGYVNVYPDAHIRGNRKAANRVYPGK